MNENEPPDIEVDIPMPKGLRVSAEDHPYHILVVADFAGSDAGTLAGPMNDCVVSLTAESLGELMRTARPTITYQTTDPLASGNGMVEVNLSFDSLRAFDPNNLITQIPATKALAAVREKIVDRIHGKLTTEALSLVVSGSINRDSALAWLQGAMSWSAKTPEAVPGAVDDLLGQLDLGDEAADDSESPPPKTAAGRLISAAADSGCSIPAEEASTLRRAIGEIDRKMSTWLTAVLHSPALQSVESAWRSLDHLVSHLDFRKGLRLSVLHAPRSTLLDRFGELLIDPVFDEGASAADLIVVNQQFGSSASDAEAMDELAQHAASLPAVVLVGVSSQFFGVKYAWQMGTLPAITNVLDQWQYAKWKTLRTQPHARSLGVVFGRCLLREPHVPPDSGKDLQFSYRERLISDKDCIWASGPIAVANSIAASIAAKGWPTAMSGYVNGRVPGFKSAIGGKNGDKTFGTCDTRLQEPKIEELGMAGLNAVVGVADHEDVLVCNGLTPARVQRNDPQGLLEVSLPYQLFAARLSTLLFHLKQHLAGLTADAVTALVTKHLACWLGIKTEPTSEQVAVQVRPSQQAASVLEMAVTVTPPESILPGGVPVVMGYRLG